jgi:hypothetical protein
VQRLRPGEDHPGSAALAAHDGVGLAAEGGAGAGHVRVGEGDMVQPLALLGAPDAEAGVGHLDQLDVRRSRQRVAEAHRLAGNQRSAAHRLEPQPENPAEVRGRLVDVTDQDSDVEKRNVLGLHRTFPLV